MKIVFERDDPRRSDVAELLQKHLEFAVRVTPPGMVHALDLDGLLGSEIEFFSAREHGDLLGVGALKLLGDAHAELKSMHTSVSARGKGVGASMVEHLLRTARARGCDRVSLETGNNEAFLPARKLYQSLGFVECEPFANYSVNDFSICMTLPIH